MNIQSLKLGVVLIIALALLAGLHLTLAVAIAAQPVDDSGSASVTSLHAPQSSLPDKFPIITDTNSQQGVGVSGDCVVFREDDGRVYLHNMTTQETLTITDKTQPVRKVAISQGVVVWHSDLSGEEGLWGYYNPACSDAGLFGTEIITPFHINSRSETRAPTLSGEMLTYMAWVPAGMWYIGLIELDENNNGIPDATEPGYDPYAEDLWVRLSCCPSWPQGYAQVLPDIYWGDDYKIACWHNDAGVGYITCYDLSHDDDDDGIPDWKDEDITSWDGQFPVSTDVEIDFDWKGIIAVHQDLVIWTDAHESDICGTDLHVVDLDLDDDGILNQYDDTPGDGPTEFVLVNRLWRQESPDMWGSFAVWSDRQNKDIYAYDLNLDSNNNDTPNWKDLEWKEDELPAPDPAQFRVTSDPVGQAMPEIWDATVVWEDDRHSDRDIYGAILESPDPVANTAQNKAIYWLDQQTVHFPKVEDIPGYIAATGMITRYKSFTSQTGSQEIIYRVWYPAITGSYVIGFDFCNCGTDDQRQFMGRYGRGFTYDQGLALIARTMLAHQTQAEDLGRYVSRFQNDGQLPTIPPGSFGFSFNGQGYGGQKDNFYDMDYLRGGANGWIGYGYLFYSRHYSDTQFTGVMTRTGDYILDQQVITATDPRYGLFKGGYGRWFENLFFEEDITWVSTEHNIDIYFFLRDLGRLTGESRYTEAANLQRENMPKLWNEAKGRLDQGMGPDGTPDTTDALDAASWGAMYWLATNNLTRAMRSLEYADLAYSNTVTVSPEEITIWGYKPYSSTLTNSLWLTTNVVWSEGSLGVAMANLKLGYALLDQCGDSRGNTYILKAREIITEMKKLQSLDPLGGLHYAISSDGQVPDFTQAPSAAGTTWFLMVQKAMEDGTLRDAFWGPDSNVKVICPSPKPIEGTPIFLPLIIKDYP